jgi:hypothetical protein
MAQVLSRTIGVTLTLFCVSLSSDAIFAQITYYPGPAPTWDLLNCTVDGYPEPYYRTDIGIGEEVFCAVTS